MQDLVADPEAESSQRAPGRIRLVLVLVALAAIVVLSRTAFSLWTPPDAPRQRPDVWSDLSFYGRYASAYLCAGLLIDSFGLRRVVGLGLIGWCGLVPLAAMLSDPLILAAIHLPVILVYGVLDVASFVAVKRGLRPGTSAPAVVIPIIASFLWLAAAAPVGRLVLDGVPAGAEGSAGRMWVALVCATLGAGLAWIWLAFYRGPETPLRHAKISAIAGLAVLLADRRIWPPLVLTGIASAVVFIGEHRVVRFLAVERGIGPATAGFIFYAPYLAAIVGAVAASIWSDRMFRDRGTLAAARRPFVVAGLALGAALALVPFVRETNVVAMTSIAACGIGVQMIVWVAAVDLAPSTCCGTFFGLLLGCGSFVRFGVEQLAIAVYRPMHSFVPILVIGGLVSLVGAFVAYRLLREMEPVAAPGEAPLDLPSLFT